MLNTIKNAPRELPLGSIESDYTLNSVVTWEGQDGIITGFAPGGVIIVELPSGQVIEALFWNLTLKVQAVTHFTFTGPHAGTTFCGQERNQRDRYIHLSTCRHLPKRRIICPLCLALYDAAGNETEEED